MELRILNDTPHSDASAEEAERLAAALDAKAAELEAALRDLQRSQQQTAFWRQQSHKLGNELADLAVSPAKPAGAPRRPSGRIGRKLRAIREFHRAHGSKGLLRVAARKFGARPASPKAPSTVMGETFDVLFVIGCHEGESKRYRVYNVAEALIGRGLKVKVLLDHQCGEIVEMDWRARAVVFFRMPYVEAHRVGEAIEHARRHSARIVFDIDDLVFDPDVVDLIQGVSILSPEQRQAYLDGVRRYRHLLELCDFATVTTAPLARAVEAVGLQAKVVSNSLNAAQIAAADRILAARPEMRPRLTIGYFSGSRTHERDFGEAEAALLALMRQRSDFDLLVVGFLDMTEAWAPFQHRVRRKGFLAPLDMLKTLGDCDINIAPLEAGALFCEAKSELKFFEAALVEVPTVASPTEPFRAAIEHGVTGFVASDQSEWLSSLAQLLDDAALRRQMGRRAREVALERFGVQAVADAAMAALLGEEQRTSARLALQPESGLKIDWIVPRLILGGGGHRNILRAAHFLQGFGHDVALHFTDSQDQAGKLKQLVVDHFYPFEGAVRAYDGQFRESDVLLATHWTTVDLALRGRAHTREVMYFVQDFEPAFAPMGSEYVLAENTYRQGLYCITSGPWCERLLKTAYRAEADHFRFPIDRQVYRPRVRTKTNRNIVFFAKPEMPRRCFEVGASALAHLHRLRPDVEIILFGSGAIKKQTLGFPATLLEVVPTINDLAAMYANADLGLVFSTTNPSLVPYEMMASGCPVVDLDRPGNEYNYDDRRDIAYLADPIPERMAEQIAALLASPDDLTDRRAKGLGFADTFPTEYDMARRVEELILGRMRKRQAA